MNERSIRQKTGPKSRRRESPLGRVLTAAREARGLSLTELAKRVTMPSGKTMSPALPNFYELGVVTPSPEILKRLAQVLELDYLRLVALAAGIGTEDDSFFAIDRDRAPHVAYLAAFSPQVLEQLREYADDLVRGKSKRAATKEPVAAGR